MSEEMLKEAVTEKQTVENVEELKKTIDNLQEQLKALSKRYTKLINLYSELFTKYLED